MGCWLDVGRHIIRGTEIEQRQFHSHAYFQAVSWQNFGVLRGGKVWQWSTGDVKRFPGNREALFMDAGGRSGFGASQQHFFIDNGWTTSVTK